jgi:hypothetical protein
MIDVKSSSTAKYGVCAPIGGFGNHVRWLVLLDPVFRFDAHQRAEQQYVEYVNNFYKRAL